MYDLLKYFSVQYIFSVQYLFFFPMLGALFLFFHGTYPSFFIYCFLLASLMPISFCFLISSLFSQRPAASELLGAASSSANSLLAYMVTGKPNPLQHKVTPLLFFPHKKYCVAQANLYSMHVSNNADDILYCSLNFFFFFC